MSLQVSSWYLQYNRGVNQAEVESNGTERTTIQAFGITQKAPESLFT